MTDARTSGAQRLTVVAPQCALRDLLHPLAAPGGRLEGVGEILRLVHDLTVVVELHDADGECELVLVVDGVFGDPEITGSDHSPYLEARRVAGMVAAQGLQVLWSEDSFA